MIFILYVFIVGMIIINWIIDTYRENLNVDFKLYIRWWRGGSQWDTTLQGMLLIWCWEEGQEDSTLLLILLLQEYRPQRSTFSNHLSFTIISQDGPWWVLACGKLLQLIESLVKSFPRESIWFKIKWSS